MHFELYRFEELASNVEVLASWRQLVRDSDNLFAQYQSVEWCRHLAIRESQRPLSVVCLTTPEGDLVGVVPLRRQRVPVSISAARREIHLGNLDCIDVLGGQPLLPAGDDVFERFLEFLLAAIGDVDGIHFKSVRDGTWCSTFFMKRKWKVGPLRGYRIDGERRFHYIELPHSHQQYLSGFRKKQRYNLRRQVRILTDDCDGQLSLVAITREDQIPSYITSAAEIARSGWKSRRPRQGLPEDFANQEWIADLARAGLLRSYLLNCRGRSVAFVHGYRFGCVYHYADIAYVQQLSRFSPGNVLLFLIVEDLIRESGIRRMNLGIGDSEYKRIFANRHSSDAAVVLLRPTLRNFVLRKAHAAMTMTKRAALSLSRSR